MRRRFVLGLLAGFSIFAVFGALSAGGHQTAFAKEVKVDVCHREGNGSYHLINVAQSALPAHLAHGDGIPGGQVIGSPRFTFGGDCSLFQTCDFSGDWAHVSHPQNVAANLTVDGDNVAGDWYDSYSNRVDFSGTLSEDGCTVEMNFPDDAFYWGTISPEAPCLIQWSYPNQEGTSDPNNQWVCFP